MMTPRTSTRRRFRFKYLRARMRCAYNFCISARRFTCWVWVVAVCALAPSAQARACRPDCRPGFTCVDGTCVSACNPLCATGETCTEELACVPIAPATRPRRSPPPEPLTWFIAPGAAYAGGEIYTSPDHHYVDSSVPALKLGGGFSRWLTGVLWLRGELSVIGGSDFDHQSLLAAFLEPSLHIGPVARPFPWLIGVGPIVGAQTLRGVDPSQGDGRGSATIGLMGGKLYTGFDLGTLELSLEARIGLWPEDEQTSGFLCAGAQAAFEL